MPTHSDIAVGRIYRLPGPIYGLFRCIWGIGTSIIPVTTSRSRPIASKIITGGIKTLLFFSIGSTVFAADLNSYTAQYECISGGANCNVDVATLTAAACDQTITTATTPTTDWTAITWTNTNICIQTGDHTGRGVLNLGASGTSGTRKVLRCVTSGGAVCSNPVDTTDANRARIKFLETNGHDYWIIDRIRIEPSGSGTYPVHFHPNSTNIIFNRFLVEGGGADGDIINVEGGSNHTIQNGVVRNSAAVNLNNDHVGIGVGNSSTTPNNIHIVNNEVYNIRGHQIQIGTSGSDPKFPGTVVENNDLYVDTSYYTDCSGNLTVAGPCAAAAFPLVIKSGGTSANPIRVIHNRIFGSRPSDNALCCDFGGDQGAAVIINADSPTADSDYVLFQNNIVFDSQYGIIMGSAGADRDSFIGNIFYGIKKYKTNEDSVAINLYGIGTGEIYLNTVIDSFSWIDPTGSNNDIRCNVAIDNGAAVGSPGSGTQMDNQVCYGTTGCIGGNTISKTLNTRANSTAYSLDDIIRTTGTPPEDGTAGDFLYKVTSAGTSAGSPPGYCTTLGCTTIDGSMTVKAIRGPYSYYRKLNTSPEQKQIPYERAHTSDLGASSCLSGFASRTGVGIDNTRP